MASKPKASKINICPACKSSEINFFVGFESGQYECKACGYVGPIILEKEVNN